MQKIVPHLWFDTHAKEAATLYSQVFPSSGIDNVRTITNTPSGDCEIVSFHLAGQQFMSISAGPHFQLNPSISLFAVFESEAEIEAAWSQLVEGGKVLMEYQTYPWASKYGWLQDKYGLSWQLSLSEHHKFSQKITPMIMYIGAMAGKAKEALEDYTHIFPDSHIDLAVPYEAGEGDKQEYLKHAQFTLCGQKFMVMDSSFDHQFAINEAFSFIVNCETQVEIDYYWEKLSAVPESEQCGWLKDKYGVSWQIIPSAMAAMMATSDQTKLDRVTQAFLQMKKFDIKTLEEAYNQ